MTQEELTRQLFHTAGDGIPAEPLAAHRVIAGARRRRGRRVAAIVAATVGLVVLGTAVVVGGHGRDRGGLPSHDPTLNPTRSTQTWREWLAGLPDGEPPGLPYIMGHTVMYASMELDLRDYRYNVVGAAPHGLLIEELAANGYQLRYGLRHEDSTERWLTPYAPAVPTVSTDGRQLAFPAGGVLRLYDLDREELVASIDAGQYASPLTITDRGIVYSGGDPRTTGKTLLWTPGREPVEMGFTPFATSTDLQYALVAEPGTPCASAVRVEADLTGTVVYEGCWRNRPLALAPDGLHVLTPDLHLIGLEDSSNIALTTARIRIWVPEAVWEDPDHVLVKVQDTDGVSGAGPVGLVRCSTDGDCESVFDRIHDVRVLDPSIRPYG